MRRVINLPLLLLFLCLSVFCQQSTEKWTTFQSDNHEFSIEMPAGTICFRDDDGFVLSRAREEFAMKKMVLLSSVVNGTLVSVESYQASKDSLDDLEEGDKRFLKNLHTSKQKLHDYTAQSLSGDRDAGFIQRRYLYSKNFVYIVTAAARDAQTPEMKRFLDSLQFTPGVAHDAGQDIKTFSAVPATKLEIDLHPPVRSVPAQAKTEDLTGSDKLVILLKPLPTFTRAARGSNTSGDILLSVTFGPAGLVTKISVHKSIGEGLLRQAVFAALRMKYLPPISGANALQPMTKRVEYSFSIY